MPRIAFIGAGSVGFTRQLFRDILSVPALTDTTFAFHDISENNLKMVAQLCDKDSTASGLNTSIETYTNRQEALIGADYIINCTRIGGLEAFTHDIEIPLKYGVDQCVGDTICAGGIMYAQRNVPAILDFCADISELANPNALFLNYANPMAINTWAAIEHGFTNTVGLCHGVQNTHAQIATALGASSKSEVEVQAAGINHQPWFIKILYRGQEITSKDLLEAFEKHPELSVREKVRIDVLRRFGYYSTESNGHLSEYLPWYRKRPEELSSWIDRSSWINGETGGYLEHCKKLRDSFDTSFEEEMLSDAKVITPETRTDEHASHIIEALETGHTYRGHFNVQNNGVIPNLPSDCIVEVPGYVDRTGINIQRLDPLPDACAATCNASISVQRMALKAALTGDKTLLKQAMLHDPLVGAVCTPQEIWNMTDEMLVAQLKWLPQYTK